MQNKQYNVCQNKLRAFIDNYKGIVNQIGKQYLSSKDEPEVAYMVARLRNWLTNEGYDKFDYSIEYSNDEEISKINDFIELYSFLLENSKRDIFKLIDQLFFIPNEFDNIFKIAC